MSLANGTRLGAYEITGQIGAGGMGEVYRATDSKLGRDVAIKTLPAALAFDKERLARFEREARLLAALNHSHIASIYSLDEHAGTLYLAMELVEGETLEEKLKPSALPVEDALRLALQIAEALEAAHEKGVVHRDLKPANVMVTKDGIVKVLDFGLAKAFSEDPNESNVAQSPALSVAMTQQGLVLGTAGYMSPEQASGQPTDQRADIWAFGVVLYEMLTGLPLFSGESVPHILADVLKTEPDWNRLPQDLHPRIRLMLERCLTKKRRNRYHSIADARVDIEQVLNNPGHAAEQTDAQTGVPARSTGIPVAGAVLLTAVAASLVAWGLWPNVPVMPVERFSHLVPGEQQIRGRNGSVIDISADGSAFVYNSIGGLYLRRIGELSARQVAGTEVAISSPVFSPDGNSLAFFSFAGEIQRIPITGGAPVEVARWNRQVEPAATWGTDDALLYAELDGIFRVAATGGTPQLIIEPQRNEMFHRPQLLPDGDTVLFSVNPGGDWNAGQTAIYSLSTGERSVLFSGGTDTRYLPTGHLVYAFEDGLFGIAFDMESLSVSGDSVPLLQGVMRAGGNNPAAQFAVSDNGTLAYFPDDGGGAAGFYELTWVDREGREEILPLSARPYGYSRVSPDGSKFAVSITEAGTGIWVSDVTRPVLSLVTEEIAIPFSHTWAADGQHVIFSSSDAGAAALKRVLADGSGQVETLLALEAGFMSPGGRTADGTGIVFTYGTGPAQPGIGLMSGESNSDGERDWRPLIERATGASAVDISPNGEWIAYHTDDTGQYGVYIERFPGLGNRRLISDERGGWGAIWSSDGREVFYRRLGDGAMMAVPFEAEPTVEIGSPTMLFGNQGYLPVETPQAGGGSPRTWDIAPDGRFLMVKTTGLAGETVSTEIVIVQNWFEELRRLVPTE